mgnify:CR=1 FL=1
MHRRMTVAVKYHVGCFPPACVDWERLAPALTDAGMALARYDEFLGIIPNPEILTAPMLMQEAVTSSRIEGTQATVGDVLEYNAGNVDVPPAKRDDIREVVNYQIAVKVAEEMLETIPLCGRILKGAHRILLSGVRGEMKSPGEYRREQNWIGTYGSAIEDARYVPAAPELVDDLMSEWEKFVNDDNLIALYKIAVAHAEFESIHPFNDGNGRIGRMIVPLMMTSAGLLRHPCFYLSEFFEKRTTEYQDRLLAVSKENDWTGWCLFFLRAVRDQALDNNRRARGIFELNQNLKKELAKRSGSSHTDAVVDKLFQGSIFSVSDFTKIDGVNSQVARRLLRLLEDMGTIKTLREASGRRPAIMVFPELLRLTDTV